MSPPLPAICHTIYLRHQTLLSVGSGTKAANMKPRIRLPHITPSRSFQSSKASRYIHQSCRARNAPLAESSTLSEIPAPPPGRGTTASSASSSPPALSLLAFPTLLRSYLVSTVSSSPLLLAPCLRFLSLLAHSTSPWLQRNPALQLILKQTFYKHFCAGETPAEVQRTAADLKSLSLIHI